MSRLSCLDSVASTPPLRGRFFCRLRGNGKGKRPPRSHRHVERHVPRTESPETRTTSRLPPPCRIAACSVQRQVPGTTRISIGSSSHGGMSCGKGVRPKSSRTMSPCASKTLSPHVTCPPNRRPRAFQVTLPVLRTVRRSVNPDPARDGRSRPFRGYIQRAPTNQLRRWQQCVGCEAPPPCEGQIAHARPDRPATFRPTCAQAIPIGNRPAYSNAYVAADLNGTTRMRENPASMARRRTSGRETFFSITLSSRMRNLDSGCAACVVPGSENTAAPPSLYAVHFAHRLCV